MCESHAQYLKVGFPVSGKCQEVNSVSLKV